MNKRLSLIACAVNVASVCLFALFMPFGLIDGCYIASIFISLSFVVMASAYCCECPKERKLAAIASVAFSVVYATIILFVYFAQLTAVKSSLTEQASTLLDYRKYGLFFDYDLLGYGLMALSTFFAGLTLEAKGKRDKALKALLLLIHGIFFFPCLIVPMLGVFSPDLQGAERLGIALLEVWCAYFIPTGILSLLHFKSAK